MSEEFKAALASSDTVAVVGVGNVALDCARILAKGEKTNITVDGSFTNGVGPCLCVTLELDAIFIF